MKEETRDINRLSDEELMLLYQAGDSESFDALYQRHSGRVYAWLGKRLYDKSLLDEAFQNTFLKLHRHRDKYQAELPFLPWLFTICNNARNDLLRRQAYALSLFDHASGTEHEAFSEETASLNIDLKSEFSEREWQALNMRLLENKSFSSIAEALNLSLDNARQIISRAGRRLTVLIRGEK